MRVSATVEGILMARIPPALRRIAIAAGVELVRKAVRSAKAGRTSAATPTSSRSDRAIPRPPSSSPDSRDRRDARREVAPSTDARPEVAYAPARDGDADPGEIVWTWVPYEDDPSRGKDRPVLVIGSWGADVAALQLTSRRHDDRHHHPVGVWDPRDGRQSWLKLDRVLRLDPDGIRREGAVLDRDRFRAAVAAWERY